MVMNGTADIADADPYAAIIALHGGLQALAVEATEDNKTHFREQAWTRKSEFISGLHELKGERACFAEYGLSTSMTMSIGYQVRRRILTPIASDLHSTVENFYSSGACAVPAICQACKYSLNRIGGINEGGKQASTCTLEDPYAGYEGAVRCLSEGEGRVAFVKDTDVSMMCEGDPPHQWCLPKGEYEEIADFGPVPLNALVYSPALLDDRVLFKLINVVASLRKENGLTFNKAHHHYDISIDLALHIKEFSMNTACVPGIHDLLSIPVELLPACIIDSPRTGQRDDPFRFAYYGEEDDTDKIKFYFNKTVRGFSFEVIKVHDAQDALRHILNHEADFAQVDAALALKGSRHGAISIAVETAGNLSFYESEAWARKDAGLDDFLSLKGLSSCHGSDSSIAGYWTKGNCAPPSLCERCMNQFQDDLTGAVSCPRDEKYYNDDANALDCLTQLRGEVAFIRSGSWDYLCTEPPMTQAIAEPVPAFCREKESYVKLMSFGKVPTDIVISHYQSMDSVARLVFQKVFTKRYDDTLKYYFGSHATGMMVLEEELYSHLFNYAENIACIPKADTILGVGQDAPMCIKSSGRDGDIEPIRIAHVANTNLRDTTELSTLLFNETGLRFNVVGAANDMEAVQMIIDNIADMAYTDLPAVVFAVGSNANMTLLAAEYAEETNKTYYNADAWVLDDSTTKTIIDTKGKKSCHPSMFSSVGNYLWLGYAVNESLVTPARLEEELFDDTGFEGLERTIYTWFNSSCAEPVLCGNCKTFKQDGKCSPMDEYAGIAGALKCLSEGEGDVAFLPDHAWEKINAFFDSGRAHGFVPAPDLKLRMSNYMKHISCVPDIHELMGLPPQTILPPCERMTFVMNNPVETVVDNSETTTNDFNQDFNSSGETTDTPSSDNDYVEPLAIAALVISILMVLIAPLLAYSIAKFVLAKWISDDRMSSPRGTWSASSGPVRGSIVSTFEPNSFDSTMSTNRSILTSTR
eukprot:CFRG7136T1